MSSGVNQEQAGSTYAQMEEPAGQALEMMGETHLASIPQLG